MALSGEGKGAIVAREKDPRDMQRNAKYKVRVGPRPLREKENFRKWAVAQGIYNISCCPQVSDRNRSKIYSLHEV